MLVLLEVLVLSTLFYSTITSRISNNHSYIITCVSVIDSGILVKAVAVLIVYFVQIFVVVQILMLF